MTTDYCEPGLKRPNQDSGFDLHFSSDLNQAKRIRAAWYVMDKNPRKAGLRYRCLYPMECLASDGYDVSFYVAGQTFDVVIFDAWDLFSSDWKQLQKLLATWGTLRKSGTRLVLDNCDNQFAGEHDAAWSNGCKYLRELAEQADTVVVCSEFLAGVMQNQCKLAKPAVVIGDPVETQIRYPGDSIFRSLFSIGRKVSWARYLRHRAWINPRRTPLVWFGFHGVGSAKSGMANLLAIRSELESVNLAYPLSLTIISNNKKKFEQIFNDWNFPVAYLEWDRITFMAAMRLHTICLLPSAVNNYTAAKSANRVVTALSCGLNVICDEIPSYKIFSGAVQFGDWRKNTELFINDPEMRLRQIASGVDLVAREFSLPAIAGKWRLVFFA